MIDVPPHVRPKVLHPKAGAYIVYLRAGTSTMTNETEKETTEQQETEKIRKVSTGAGGRVLKRKRLKKMFAVTIRYNR